MSATGNYIPEGTTFETFDPNKQFGEKPLWGVLNTNKFKTYTQRGHAINAFLYHYQTKLYQQNYAGWQLIAVKDPNNLPKTCQNCGAIVGLGHYGRRQGSFRFKKSGNKIVDPLELLFVCPPCVGVVDP